MSNNFNLRTFLSENKLTKNSKLLNENSYKATVVFSNGSQGRKVESFPVEAQDENEAREKITAKIQQEHPGQEHRISIHKIAAPREKSTGPVDGIQVNGKKVNKNSIELDDVDHNDYPDYSDAYISSAEFEDGTELTPDELDELNDNYNDIAGEMLTSGGMYEEDKPKTSDPAVPVDSTGMAVDMLKKGIYEDEQSARDRRIVEMVQRALGVEAPVSEEEMVEKEPLPKYESIEKLMQEIEHGTNKTMYEYKMSRMIEIAEMLETKVGSLEEGEHAEHINPKDIKQMRKDIAALRKAEEKLRKEYDKKFAVKEKPAKKEVAN